MSYPCSTATDNSEYSLQVEIPPAPTPPPLVEHRGQQISPGGLPKLKKKTKKRATPKKIQDIDQMRIFANGLKRRSGKKLLKETKKPPVGEGKAVPKSKDSKIVATSKPQAARGMDSKTALTPKPQTARGMDSKTVGTPKPLTARGMDTKMLGTSKPRTARGKEMGKHKLKKKEKQEIVKPWEQWILNF